MDFNKTQQDIKNRKEESLRESTNNPKEKPLEINGKQYDSFTDYLNSKEYKEFLELQEESINLYAEKAKEYFQSLDTEQQHLLFFHITNTIFENYFNDNGSYRGLLYDKFKFGPESYALGCDSGMFSIHNAIETPQHIERKFQALIKHLKINPDKEELLSLRHIFEYGYDNSPKLKELLHRQQKFDF